MLTFIERFLAEHGFPPTVREIGSALGLAPGNGVTDHLKALRTKGVLTWTPMKARSLQLVRLGQPSDAWEPTPQNLAALPAGVRQYIESLQSQLSGGGA